MGIYPVYSNNQSGEIEDYLFRPQLTSTPIPGDSEESESLDYLVDITFEEIDGPAWELGNLHLGRLFSTAKETNFWDNPFEFHQLFNEPEPQQQDCETMTHSPPTFSGFIGQESIITFHRDFEVYAAARTLTPAQQATLYKVCFRGPARTALQAAIVIGAGNPGGIADITDGPALIAGKV